MGLDMYAYAVNIENVVDDFDFNRYGEEDTVTEIAYWRKHRHLHNYMEAFYRKKRGTEESFNCVPIRLYAEDIEELRQAIKSSKLSSYDAVGLFFGSNECYESFEEKKRDLMFLVEAEIALEEGKAVYYNSWW